MGSWGFDVNRPINAQTSLSFASTNNNNNNNHNNDQYTIKRTIKDYNERLVDIPSPVSSQNFRSYSPTLTRHRHGSEFDAIDRLVLGPNRIIESNCYPSKNSFQQTMLSNKSSQLNSTNQRKIQTEQQLLAWQNRMLEKFVLYSIRFVFVIIKIILILEINE